MLPNPPRDVPVEYDELELEEDDRELWKMLDPHDELRDEPVYDDERGVPSAL